MDNQIDEAEKELLGLIEKLPLSERDKKGFSGEIEILFKNLKKRTAPYDYGGKTGDAGDVCAEAPYDDLTVSEAEEIFGKK